MENDITMRKNIFILLTFIGFVARGCTISYSTTGADIGDARSVSVQYFPNRAPLVTATLSDVFTEALKDRFISQTSLTLVNGQGDLNFKGEITGYETSPVAITENDVAASNRLTITIHVVFTNSKNSEFDFDERFSRYSEYESSQQLSDVESTLIEEIVDEIVDDVFNKSVVNW